MAAPVSQNCAGCTATAAGAEPEAAHDVPTASLWPMGRGLVLRINQKVKSIMPTKNQGLYYKKGVATPVEQT